MLLPIPLYFMLILLDHTMHIEVQQLRGQIVEAVVATVPRRRKAKYDEVISAHPHFLPLVHFPNTNTYILTDRGMDKNLEAHVHV
jgi:hypothetical protein